MPTRAHRLLAIAVAPFTVLMTAVHLDAQPGPSFSASYEMYPDSKIANPDTEGGDDFLETSEINVTSLNLTASYPLIYSEGRTVLVNELGYSRVALDYIGFPETAANPENLHAIEYNATITHGLSDKWTLMGIVTPGIASDFEGDLSSDDLTFQAVLVWIRAYSERLQIGYGAAWSNTFGQPYPLPILAVRWNNGSNLRLSAILPVNLEVWYAPSENLHLGLLLAMDGNQYHGDADIYEVDNPLLRYSVGTVGPSVNYYFAPGLAVGATAGMTFTRRFEFFDGDDEAADISLENSGFVKLQLQYGG